MSRLTSILALLLLRVVIVSTVKETGTQYVDTGKLFSSAPLSLISQFETSAPLLADQSSASLPCVTAIDVEDSASNGAIISNCEISDDAAEDTTEKQRSLPVCFPLDGLPVGKAKMKHAYAKQCLDPKRKRVLAGRDVRVLALSETSAQVEIRYHSPQQARPSKRQKCGTEDEFQEEDTNEKERVPVEKKVKQHKKESNVAENKMQTPDANFDGYFTTKTTEKAATATNKDHDESERSSEDKCQDCFSIDSDGFFNKTCDIFCLSSSSSLTGNILQEMVRANSTEESIISQNKECMGDAVEDVSQHHSSILDDTFQCELGCVSTSQSREDEKREKNRARMEKYRLKLRTDAEQHFQTHGLCTTTGSCFCPQHRRQGILVKDKTQKKAARDTKKAAMEAHLEANGVCMVDDDARCDCPQHAYRESQNNVVGSVRKHRETLKENAQVHMDASGKCMDTSGKCKCPQHKLADFEASEKERKKASRMEKKASNQQDELKDPEIEEIADVVAGNPRDTGRSLEYFYSDEELKQMDETFAFGPLQTDAELYKKIAPKLSFDNLTVRCCGVCDCGSKCNDMAYEEITEEFIKKLRRRLSIPPEAKLHEDLINEYSLTSFDERLEGILLSRHGVYIKDGQAFISIDSPPDHDHATLFLGLCIECGDKINAAQTTAESKRGMLFPPVNAIANGNWIGYLPHEYLSYTRSDEQCLALMQACIYLSTIVGNKPAKSICSHGYVIKNPDAIINSIPKEITGVVRMTLVGAFTPLAEASARQRFVLNHEMNKRFLNEFLLVKNTKYMEHAHLVNRNGFDGLDREDMQIINRLDGGNNPVNPKLIRIMEFDHTSHHNDNGRVHIKDMEESCKDDQECVPINGVENEDEQENDVDTLIDENPLQDLVEPQPRSDDDDDEMVTSTRIRVLFTPPDVYSARTMNPNSTDNNDEAIPELDAIDVGVALGNTTVETTKPASGHAKHTDYLVHNSNNYATHKTFGNFTLCFPFLFPYGRGGYDEQRPVKMSEKAWYMRCLRIHGAAFQTHYGFIAMGYDSIATQLAYNAQYVAMRFSRRSIDFGLINKDTVRLCIKHQADIASHKRRGLKIPAAPPEIKKLMDLSYGIRPGMAAVMGSDESRGSARKVAFGFAERWSIYHLFITFSPDTSSTYVISINSWKVKPEDCETLFSFRVPNKSMRKATAAENAYLSGSFAYDLLQVFIEEFLGWDQKMSAPKRGGGAVGVVRQFAGGAESKQSGDVHFHMVVSVRGFPKTTEKIHELFKSAEFRKRVAAFIDSFNSPLPPEPLVPEIDSDGNRDRGGNGCPKRGCDGVLRALEIPGDAYCKPTKGRTPIKTCMCPDCGCSYGHVQVVKERLEAWAADNGVNITPEKLDHFRCSPPPLDVEWTLEEQGLFASAMVEFQYHYETHASSCFHKTKRTPQAIVCRFFYPRMIQLLESYITTKGEHVVTRLLGQEYYNMCNLLWARLFKANSDFQMLLNKEGAKCTDYTTKYCFKFQHLDSQLTMKIGLLIDASSSLLNRPDDADLSPGDRGRRFINCLLYKASKPQEISLALAVFGLLNDGSLFFFSHGFKRIKLEAAAACYPRSKVDVIPITESGAQQKEYVEIDIPLSQLRHSETESSTSLENETDRCLDICKMHDYWFRPTTEAFEELSYLQIMEYYYLKPGKGPHKMALGHPMPESHNWTKNPYGKTCCGIVYGKGLPNIYDPDSNTIENREYYYKSLLLLFKPHRRKEDLILAYDSYEDAYAEFAASGTPHAEEAKLYVELHKEKYYNVPADDDDVNIELTEEEQILLDHPCLEKGEVEDGFGNERQNIIRKQKNQHHEAELDAFLESGGEFAAAQLDNSALPDNLAKTAALHIEKTPQVRLAALNNLPKFLSMQDYESRLKDPVVMSAEDNSGTHDFRRLLQREPFRIQVLDGFAEPVPHVQIAGDPDTSQLKKFASISEVSQALRLNLLQHFVFETYARHLLYMYAYDIAPTQFSKARPPSLKPQLVGYMGGGAGTGKSAVISALLTFARLWGRRSTIETMAFMGLAGLNIDGDTIHSHRGLDIHLRFRPCPNVAARLKGIYLSIIDEISMVEQKLLGMAEIITRRILNKNIVWGGIHCLMAGDFLQLPPNQGNLVFQPPEDKRTDASTMAALALWDAINFRVMLQTNMRQDLDRPFVGILRRNHWGMSSQDDLDVLNQTCSIESHSHDIESTVGTSLIDARSSSSLFSSSSSTPSSSSSSASSSSRCSSSSSSDEHFEPMAIGLNKQRCAFQRHAVRAYCCKFESPMYQIQAYACKRSNQRRIDLLNYLDDDATYKIPLLLEFYLGMPIMITKRLKQLNVLRVVSNGTLGTVIGFVHEDGTTTTTDDAYFDLQNEGGPFAIKRFKKLPALLLIHIRGCHKVLVEGYPPGVIGLPPYHDGVKIKLPQQPGGSNSWEPTLKQFPVIGCLSMTPEKLQGVTLFSKLYIGILNRPGYKPACLHVALSRVLSMDKIVLSEPLTMEYVNKFHPTILVLLKMQELLMAIDMPPYATPSQLAELQEWLEEERELCRKSIRRYYDLKHGITRESKRKRKE